jgi:hypothetical protein
VACKLLGDGTAPGNIISHEYIPRGTEGAPETESLVLEKLLIFPGYKGVDKMLGKLVNRNNFPLFVGKELGYEPVFGVKDLGRQGGLVLSDIFDVLNIPRFRQGYAEADAYNKGAEKTYPEYTTN